MQKLGQSIALPNKLPWREEVNNDNLISHIKCICPRGDDMSVLQAKQPIRVIYSSDRRRTQKLINDRNRGQICAVKRCLEVRYWPGDALVTHLVERIPLRPNLVQLTWVSSRPEASSPYLSPAMRETLSFSPKLLLRHIHTLNPTDDNCL